MYSFNMLSLFQYYSLLSSAFIIGLVFVQIIEMRDICKSSQSKERIRDRPWCLSSVGRMRLSTPRMVAKAARGKRTLSAQGHCIYPSSAPPHTQTTFHDTKTRSHSTACASIL
jgi:2,4-dienoyl-CoA reductase-like NADH-dependent reductase (Old Yellow Enzyme family)